MNNLEKVLTSFTEQFLQDCMTCMPAVVVNVKNMSELRVDVKPITNGTLKTGEVFEYPLIQSVPVIMPSTSSSAVLMPLKQGDTVLLVFAQRNINIFKSGSTTPHNTDDTRYMNINDAVAIAGLSPFNKSPNLQLKHTLPHSVDDLTVVHNLGTDNECEIRLKANGDIVATGASMVNDFGLIDNSTSQMSVSGSLKIGTGATGTFGTPTGQVVTVKDGVVVNIF